MFQENKKTKQLNTNIAQAYHNSMFFKPVIQPLAINSANDQYEQEADFVADNVMKMPVLQPSSFFKPVSTTGIQRKCKHCEEETKQLQRTESNSQTPVVSKGLENYIASLDNSGSPLPQQTRSFFEPRMGYDFSNVKVHTDSNAAQSAQSVNAIAYTNGNNIVFNSAQYSPDSATGKKLLAHELTHVVQQSEQSPILQRYPKGTGTVPRPMEKKIDKALGEMQSSSLDYEVAAAANILSGKIDIAFPDFVDTSISPPEAMPVDSAMNRKLLWEQNIVSDLEIKAFISATNKEIPIRKGAEAFTPQLKDFGNTIYLLAMLNTENLATVLLHEMIHLGHPLAIAPGQPGAEREKFISEIRCYYYATYRHINNLELRFERAVLDAEKDTGYLAGSGIPIEQVLLNRLTWMAEVGVP